MDVGCGLPEVGMNAMITFLCPIALLCANTYDHISYMDRITHSITQAEYLEVLMAGTHCLHNQASP